MKHKIEYLIAGCFIQLVRLLPLGVGVWLGGIIGSLYHWIDPKHRRLAIDHLHRAFGDKKDLQTIKQMAWDSCKNMGMSIAESIHLPSLDRAAVTQWVDIDGLEHYVEANQRGKGVIILTAHLGNWEIIPKGFWSVGYCINAVVRPLDNPYLDRVVQDWRRKNGMGVLNKRTDVHRIMTLLRAGETVGFLLDQNTVEQDAVFVDFFGQKAATHKGPALLALRSGAAVIPVFAIREGSRHRIIIEKPLPLVRTKSNANDILQATALFTKTIELVVARYPAQWLWIHRRWKTQETRNRSSPAIDEGQSTP